MNKKSWTPHYVKLTLLGLTKICWDSPFSKVVSPGTNLSRILVRTLHPLIILNSFHIVCMLRNKKVCIPCDDEDDEINPVR